MILLTITLSIALSCTQNNRDEKINSTSIEERYDSLKAKKAEQKENEEKSTQKRIKEDYNRTIKLREQYIGKERDYEFVQSIEKECGRSEILPSTDNTWLVEYFPEKDFTLLTVKKSRIVYNVTSGKNNDIIYDHTPIFYKHIGKKMKWEDYVELFDITVYGVSKKLDTEGCIGRECTEYYKNHNFTTLSNYTNHSPGQDYVTLIRIYHGEHPNLREY